MANKRKSDIENQSQLNQSQLAHISTPLFDKVSQLVPRAITAIYCHLGVYICSRAETTFKAAQGYKLTETDRGIMVQSPDAPSVTSKPGHYVLVPWSNLHAVAYEPDRAAE